MVIKQQQQQKIKRYQKIFKQINKQFKQTEKPRCANKNNSEQTIKVVIHRYQLFGSN